MPLFPRRCINPVCRHTFEVFCALADRDVIRCDRCKAPTETNASELRVRTDHQYIGADAISPHYSVIPQEVGDARRMLEHTGARIHDNGQIEIPTKTAAKKFKQAWDGAQRAAGVDTRPAPKSTGNGEARRKKFLRERIMARKKG